VLRGIIGLLIVACPSLLAADPADLFWQAGADRMLRGGSLAPPTLLDSPRADFPTSLARAGRGRVEVEARRQVPLTLRRGRRESGSISAATWETNLAVPLAPDGAESAWAAGWRTCCVSTELRHRLRRDETYAEVGATAISFGAAWESDGWTVGVGRSRVTLDAVLGGDAVAELQHVRRGREGLTARSEGPLDTIAVQRRAGRWLVGAQVARRDATTEVPVAIDEQDYLGVFTSGERRLDAWLARDAGPRRWLAWVSKRSVDPGPSAITAGTAIRGRGGLATDETLIGVGWVEHTPRLTRHLELTAQRADFDLSGCADRGALGGGLTGRYRLSARAGADTIGLRWGEQRAAGRWRWGYGLSVLHGELDFHGEFMDSPGPFARPDTHWDQRLRDGEAWLTSASVGAGYRAGGWGINATYTVLGGHLSAEFEDLTEPEPPGPSPGPPPEPRPSGPGARLDPGWMLSVCVSREL